MQSTQWSDATNARYMESIKSKDARDAFSYLLQHAKTLTNYECHSQDQGYIQSFRYHHIPDLKYCFGVIINRKSLTFYYRRPGLATNNTTIKST